MSEIINQWIQEKLGILISSKPEVFCDLTKDGYLLSKILRSYEIITEEQLNMIQKSDNKDICLSNFKNHIVHWLKIVNIHLENEEIINIVEGQRLTSLNLFYSIYLELNNKDTISFFAKNKLNQQLRPAVSKFTVSRIKSNPFRTLNNSGRNYKSHMETTYDVVHWLQDRFEMVVCKCKAAREEYLASVRNSEGKTWSHFTVPLYILSGKSHGVDRSSPRSVELTYDELVEESHKTRKQNFQPNITEAISIIQRIQERLKHKADTDMFRKEMEQWIRKVFWNRLISEENQDFENYLSSSILKQALYEKQMLRKLEEIVQQKEAMLNCKQLIVDQTMREREALFAEKLLEKDENLDKKKFQYYLEKDRLNQLHRVLYEEKQRLKEERKQNICRDTVNDLCDMTIKYAEFQSYFGEPPTERVLDQWKKLIISGYSLEEPAVSAADLVDEKTAILEKIRLHELTKQNAMDGSDFESYVNFEWPWLLRHINVEEDTLYKMNCGMNVLGQKVHLLLEEKYPLHPLPPPPDLPKASIRVCVNGLSDITCLPMLTRLLEYKKILVIELQDAVNYCMDAYKKEIFIENDDYSKVDNPDEKPQGEKEKDKVRKGKKSKAKKRPKKEDIQRTDLVDKLVQTPRIFPSEDVELSPHAELGRIANEQLSDGNSLTDYLLVSMFLEYLKAQSNIEGWVLVNYPTNFEQAILLEEGLSGLTVPGVPESNKICKSLIDIVYISEPGIEVEEDERRFSKIVMDPTRPIEPPPYDTVLTAFINVCPDLDQQTSEWSESTKELTSSTSTESSEDINLKQFYADMGCYYSLYYKSFEYSSLKELAKLIIGDYSIPPKTSIELFGDTIRYIETEKVVDGRTFRSTKAGEKLERQRIEKVVKKTETSYASSEIGSHEKKSKKDDKKSKKGKKKEKKGKKQKKRTIIVHEDKFTNIPSVTIIEVDPDELAGYQIEPKPGEPGYRYLTLPLAEKVGAVITNFWEHLEEVYVNDFNQVLFLKRTHLNTLVPYICYIRSFINKHIIKPDDRQMYLIKFQERFNQFDNDFRRDSEFKAELHCLVNELKNKLLDICDTKMIQTEQERRALINKNWGPTQLSEIINNYINAFQLELDRHIDTLIFINDYFIALITQVLSEKDNTKEILEKVHLESRSLQKLVNDYFLQLIEVEKNDLLNEKIESVYYTAVLAAEKRDIAAFEEFEKIKLLFHPDLKKGKRAKAKKNTKTLFTVFEPSFIVKKYQEQIFDEWLCALQGEIARIEVRFLLLKYDMTENVNWFINVLKNAFNKIYTNIEARYTREVQCIKKACHFFSSAIENEVPIQEELLFIDDEFLINADTLMFESPVEQIAEELEDDFVCTVLQLRQLTDILFDFAPEGVLPRAKFTFLLQDFIANEDPYLVPKEWRRLQGYRVKELTNRLFENQSYIPWKDFIIYNLSIPIPTDENILALKYQFLQFDENHSEIVSKEDFFSAHFWFESENQDNNDSSLKNLLFRMYQYDKESCNYTAMLLDFCKGASTQEGIAKALIVVAGRAGCWSEDIGNDFVKIIFNKRQMHEEEVQRRDKELEEYRELVGSIINDLIDVTVHTCDSVVITEILPEEDQTELIEKEIEEIKVMELETENKGEYIIFKEDENIVDETTGPSVTETLGPDTKVSEPDEKAISLNIAKKMSRASRISQSRRKRRHTKSIQNTKSMDKDTCIKEDTDSTPLACSSMDTEKSSTLPSSTIIGFESQDYPSLGYFLRFEDIAVVLAATLSDILSSKDQHFFEDLCHIYQRCKNSDFNNDVLCHEFLNNKDFIELMEGKTKFVVKSPGRIVKDLLQEYN